MPRLIFLFIPHVLILFLGTKLEAQITFPENGARDQAPSLVALTNATIYMDANTKLENATLVIDKGEVIAVGSGIDVPRAARIIDLTGNYIYPSFIELYSEYGLTPAKRAERPSLPQYESNRKGSFGWNEAIKADQNASESFVHDDKKAKSYLQSGFGVVMSHHMDGIIRGSAVISTLAPLKENETIIEPEAAQVFSFSKGVSRQSYPGSLMGSIALIRQTFYDAQWYANQGNKKEENLSLKALNENFGLVQIFETRDKWEILRAQKIADEMGLKFIYKGSGDEYQRIEEIKKTNAALIVPIGFPNAFDVSDPFATDFISLEDMKHWEMAPANLAMLSKAGIKFAITTNGLKDLKSFQKNLSKAVEYGLSEKSALEALTSNPASFIKQGDKIGALKKGYQANFMITSGNIFNSETKIFEHWVQGIQMVFENYIHPEILGKYNLSFADKSFEFAIKGSNAKPNASYEVVKEVTKTDSTTNETTTKNDTSEVKMKFVHLDGGLVNLSFEGEEKGFKGQIRLSGTRDEDDKSMKGSGELPDGTWTEWSATLLEASSEKEKKEKKKELPEIGKLWFPNKAYGWENPPQKKDALFTNCTVWTNEAEGKQEQTDVFIQNGKIKSIGKNLAGQSELTGVEIIDGTGKHLTPGIIDEHSHIAISRGVNEGSQASSAEVSIGDVIDPDDINIYRQLAGGVTASQLLHGSANPIGGQSGIVKLRWGKTAEEMKIKNSAPFIKFALGENVKQSNWGDNQNIRFPQTRMGVEQVFYDHFIRAKEYDDAMKKYTARMANLKKSDRIKAAKEAPRRDIELDVMAQILNKERFVTCHSYVQSEVNMLMHVADSMNFNINTFTHILEGYKVADKMKEHGAAGSTFSDWWAYKFEVKDAIPFNAALMHGEGVVVGINSDDAEMGRRLNQEAAKGVKYGGMSEEEALKMVTLNPAKMLHLDQNMGSIKVGKDADLVLWSDHPLSIYAKAEKTFVDGVCYFDLEQDKLNREIIRKERARLIQKMLDDKGEDSKKSPEGKRPKQYHCDTLGE